LLPSPKAPADALITTPPETDEAVKADPHVEEGQAFDVRRRTRSSNKSSLDMANLPPEVKKLLQAAEVSDIHRSVREGASKTHLALAGKFTYLLLFVQFCVVILALLALLPKMNDASGHPGLTVWSAPTPPKLPNMFCHDYYGPVYNLEQARAACDADFECLAMADGDCTGSFVQLCSTDRFYAQTTGGGYSGGGGCVHPVVKDVGRTCSVYCGKGDYPSITRNELICSQGHLQLFLLFLSRTTAFAMYPALVMVFLTKCKALNMFLSRSVMALIVPISDIHNFHVVVGHQIWILTLVHTVCHIARWAIRGEQLCDVETGGTPPTHPANELLWKSVCGRSGLAAIGLLVPIIVLMSLKASIRSKISWEIRKSAHNLASVFGFALLFHNINVLAVMIATVSVYLLDRLVVYIFYTTQIETTLFTNQGTGTLLSIKLPSDGKALLTNRGFINLCIPWVSTFQWHPFSFYREPDRPDYAFVFIQQVGGPDSWTSQVQESVKYHTHRPVWIQGTAHPIRRRPLVPFGTRSLDEDLTMQGRSLRRTRWHRNLMT
jgi:hypothetical protein